MQFITPLKPESDFVIVSHMDICKIKMYISPQW